MLSVEKDLLDVPDMKQSQHNSRFQDIFMCKEFCMDMKDNKFIRINTEI